jgi:RHS repeat-associated protein
MRALNRISGVLSAVAVAALLPISTSQAATYFYHTDHLGTPQALTDKNQQVVWQSEQEPFGEVTATTHVVEQNLRFPGQYYDVETGLHYNYFRDYNSSIGRYVQSDPVGLIGGLNTYLYSLNNPITLKDPYGLWTFGYSGNFTFGAGHGQTHGVNIVVGYSKEHGITADIQRVIGFGLHLGADIGISGNIEITNASQVSDLCGPGYQYGGSVGRTTTPFAYEAAFIGSDAYSGVSFGGGLGIGTPISGQIYKTYTTKYP